MRTIILDPNLDGEHGHHALYDRVIAREFRRRGVDPLILSHENFPRDTLDGVPVKRLFQTTAYRAFSKDRLFAAFDDVELGNQAVLAELSAIPQDMFDPGDLVIVHTVSEITLVGLVNWIADLPIAKRPCFCIFLMLPAGIGPDEAGELQIEKPAAALAYREAFRIVREHRLNIHFFGSGPQHAHQFSNLAGVKIPSHPILTTFDETLPRAEPQGDRVLLFAGDAKINKGVDKLPGVIEALCPKHPELRFMIHANPEPAWGPALEALEALKTLAGDHPNLELKLAPLPGDVFADLLGSAATVLLPYDSMEYRRKSSGVVWEAIASKSTLVVPADTWLEAECIFWGASHESYSNSEPSAMAKAVTQALQAASDARDEAAERFSAANGIKAMVDQLTDRWMSAGAVFASPEGDDIRLGAEGLAGQGWYELETAQQSPVRWSSDAASVRVPIPGKGAWEIMFSGAFSFSDDQVENATIMVDGMALETRSTREADGSWTVAAEFVEEDPEADGSWTVAAEFVEEDPEAAVRSITLKPGWVMEDGDDPRKLGLLTKGLTVVRCEGGADTTVREALIPVSKQEAPGTTGWTEPLTAASYSARVHKGCAATLRFAVRAAGRLFDADSLLVLVNGQPVSVEWTRSKGFELAHCDVPPTAAPMWESLDVDIVSAAPVELKMEKLEWRRADALQVRPEPFDLKQNSDSAEILLKPVAQIEDVTAKANVAPAPELSGVMDNLAPEILRRVREAIESGLELSVSEDRSAEEHASLTIRVAGLRVGGQKFGELFVKLLTAADYDGVELRENDHALQLLNGIPREKIGLDQYGGYVRIFVSTETGAAEPHLSEIATDGNPLVILLVAMAEKIGAGAVEGLNPQQWSVVARKVATALSSDKPASASDNGVQITCAEDRSDEAHASLTLQIDGLTVNGRSLPTFFLKLLKGEDYTGVELRENDGAFVLLPGLDRSTVESDNWGPYVRFFTDPETGTMQGLGEAGGDGTLQVALEAIDRALHRHLSGVEDPQGWSSFLREAQID
ncbi:hypothetical protein NHF40_02065 [Maricaulaceae bacterium EIL42A08]|nr:hypothetical protein [Maricaulaceae bacterium EIL42A08]